MPLDLGFLDNAIANLQARIVNASTIGLTEFHDGPTGASQVSIGELVAQLTQLQRLRDRISGVAPVSVRGRITGLPGGTVAQNSNWQ